MTNSQQRRVLWNWHLYTVPEEDNVWIICWCFLRLALLVKEGSPCRVPCAETTNIRRCLCASLLPIAMYGGHAPCRRSSSTASTYCTVSSFVTFRSTVRKAWAYAGPACNHMRVKFLTPATALPRDCDSMHTQQDVISRTSTPMPRPLRLLEAQT